MIAPYYCELSEKYPSIMFLLVDVDELAVSSKAITIIIYLKLSKNILISTALYVDVHWETEIFICKSIIKWKFPGWSCSFSLVDVMGTESIVLIWH